MHVSNDSPVVVGAARGEGALTVSLPNESATATLGRCLAKLLLPGMVVWLDGDLGAGKTSLVRSMLRALGHEGPVKSPTYTLVEVYVVSSIYFYHFDFYRFNQPEEFEDAGLGEYFQKNAICLVEWPAKAAGYVPAPDLELTFYFGSDTESQNNGRLVEIRAGSQEGRACLGELSNRIRRGGS